MRDVYNPLNLALLTCKTVTCDQIDSKADSWQCMQTRLEGLKAVRWKLASFSPAAFEALMQQVYRSCSALLSNAVPSGLNAADPASFRSQLQSIRNNVMTLLCNWEWS